MHHINMMNREKSNKPYFTYCCVEDSLINWVQKNTLIYILFRDECTTGPCSRSKPSMNYYCSTHFCLQPHNKDSVKLVSINYQLIFQVHHGNISIRAATQSFAEVAEMTRQVAERWSLMPSTKTNLLEGESLSKTFFVISNLPFPS